VSEIISLIFGLVGVIAVLVVPIYRYTFVLLKNVKMS